MKTRNEKIETSFFVKSEKSSQAEVSPNHQAQEMKTSFSLAVKAFDPRLLSEGPIFFSSTDSLPEEDSPEKGSTFSPK